MRARVIERGKKQGCKRHRTLRRARCWRSGHAATVCLCQKLKKKLEDTIMQRGVPRLVLHSGISRSG